MKTTTVEQTIPIFERMCNNLPPLLPEKTIKNMRQALEQVKNNPDLTEEELERTMVHFAKLIWPYNQAFQELYKSYERLMAEDLFVQKLSPMLRKRYFEYKATGHGYIDVAKGKNLAFFAHHERVLLQQVVVDIVCDTRTFVFQALTHRDRETYLERVDEFKEILEHIELQLDSLRELAEHEQEHPQLAAEIREHVRGFEHSFAFLGPKVDYTAVCAAHEHFEGRKKHLKIRI